MMFRLVIPSGLLEKEIECKSNLCHITLAVAPLRVIERT